ncbi:precorrin-6y C5,15-methyltransferase (decarboxylating) subunit CbiE [Methanobacterium sp. ACI-7]|uniref:precorrin-6y C5,15-methyltransferase (decarboxylating) subunit CbiE n=1 Tax=unclassified Methanobacterium TaxID=2627676 RepID=UPI0039C4E37F
MSKLYIVGIGPGSKDYLTSAALNVVGLADIIFGSKRALDLFETKVQKIELDTKNMIKSFKDALGEAGNGKNVVILSTGDPGFSGILKPILKLNKDIEIEVIPGISSVQLCAAKLKIPWDEANIVTMHGKGISEDILDTINNEKPSIILPNFKPRELAQFLIENGIDRNKKAAVCEKLSYEDERIIEGSLEDIAEMEFNYMSVIVIY